MGGGGGGGGHTPYEAPETGRSKQAVKIVEIISEGEIKGLVNGVQSVFLDNTPIQNKDGTWNFSNVEAEGRIGIQDQDILEGFNTSEKEVSVGTQVRKNTPLTRTVSDPKVSRLRLTLGVQSLFQQNDQGDTHGASVTLNIFIGARVIQLTISGKYSSQYLRQIEIDNLPPAPFIVRVERVETDSISQRLQNNTIWASYTEIIETQLAYPNTALVGIKFDSDYFSAIPNRTYEVYGIIVQVPSNYDPQTRTYTGIGDGTFKAAWSDNPAWVLYDLLKNKRYGFGRRIGDFAVDKWALYNIARYCDQLVDDGFGGKEPRFTCNAWSTEQRQAYDVINDICSIFRAMLVWNGREFTVIQDRPTDPVWTYTNANVDKEGFTYSYSAMKARHNKIHVEYANAQNNYEKDVICVSDDDLIRRYGLNVKKVTAFGCTSRGQAYRTGRWILETEKLETRTVTFTVGAEGLMHVPGDIILVADNDYAGTQIGGRVLSVEQNTVTIDRETQFKAGDKFMFYNQAAEVVSVKVAEVLTGNKLRLEVPPAGLTEYGVWLRHGDKIQPQLYRALSIKEDRNGKYTITAIQHEPQKEAIVDSGAHFEPVSFSETPERYRIQNVDVAVTDGGVKLTFDYFAKNESIVKYQVKLYRTFDGKTSLYKVYDDLTTTSITFAGLPNGSYTAEIRAKNGVGQLSDPVTRTFEINLDIKRFVTKSLLFAIELDWDLPKTAAVGNYTEVWRSTTNDISKAVKVATLPYPQNNYIMSGVSLNEQYYFWLRCGDKNDNKGEFTAAVFGEADHNPDNLLNALEGKITKSQLGQELINSIKADINNAVGEEAKTRQTAVAGALAQIAAQAQSSGTTIKNLEKADQAQAETIKTVTAKAESALSGITAVRQAQAQSDKANAQQINALTAKVGNAESTVSQVSSAVAGLNGKVSSMHTIKTQAIAGGRTAVAGIALGANHEESSVIVMADKFGIVANANDGNVKPVFSVADGQVGIRGDLVVAGSVTRDKLSSGGGGNLFYNPIFANPTDGVPHGWTKFEEGLPDDKRGERLCLQDPDYGLGKDGYLKNENILRWHNKLTGNVNTRCGIHQNVPVSANKWYMVSAYMGNHSCSKVEIYIDVRGRNGEWLLHKTTPSVPKNKNFVGINDAERAFIKFQVPPNGVSVDVFFFFYDADGSNANGCWMFVGRPMLEECTEHTTEPSPWQNAGLTEVHGGSIIANTIRGDHIQANQTLRAPIIQGGQLNIGDGRFAVNNQGLVSIRANPKANVGLNINNETIIVYDERGVVRVKIGRLS
jgi:predicted phage tail protein|nr:MAG TPA: tail protein [Caudoviricetes sp.]